MAKELSRNEMIAVMQEIETERFGHPCSLVGISKKNKAELAEILSSMRTAQLLHRYVERTRPSLYDSLNPEKADKLQFWGRLYRYADNLMAGYSKTIAKQKAGNW